MAVEKENIEIIKILLMNNNVNVNVLNVLIFIDSSYSIRYFKKAILIKFKIRNLIEL